ncbi:MAG TPA: HAD family phosphatase [Tepidisphaeraceae bacterium]|nr:HAD family phosphatase [Tepidisphaeraceae bacterium]
MMVKLVVFDLGRVLFGICDDWTHACRCAGVALPGKLPDAQARRLLEDLAHRGDTGELDFPSFARAASPLMGMTPREIKAASDAYLTGPCPGTIALLEELRASGIETACLSNTNDNHWRIMNDSTQAGYFPLDRLTHRFASHLVGARKPDPAIYEHVERATGRAGSEILFFDDLPENVEGAAKRGWRVCRIDPGPNNPEPQIRAALKEVMNWGR